MSLIFYLASYIIIFFKGEHLGGPAILFYLIEVLDGSRKPEIIIETLGLLLLFYCFIKTEDKNIRYYFTSSVLLLWVPITKHIFYLLEQIQFINEYYFIITVIPFTIGTIILLLKVWKVNPSQTT